MKNIVMTGGTSGFGKLAAEMLSKYSDCRLILGARKCSGDDDRKLRLDLSSLESTHEFILAVKGRLNGEKINALVLNAGMSSADDSGRTIDGFETTFAVNYLSHYLILSGLKDSLAENSTVIMTTSGTYDPAEKTIIPPPVHADAFMLAYPEKNPVRDRNAKTGGGRAYSSSKLCIVLAARALAKEKNITAKNARVVAWDPGPVPGTGLARNSPQAVRVLWKLLSCKPVITLLPKMNSMNLAAKTLCSLVTEKNIPETGKTYIAMRKGKLAYPGLSALAADDEIMKKLVEDSDMLVGRYRT